jgi:hypothetical protein
MHAVIPFIPTPIPFAARRTVRGGNRQRPRAPPVETICLAFFAGMVYPDFFYTRISIQKIQFDAEAI